MDHPEEKLSVNEAFTETPDPAIRSVSAAGISKNRRMIRAHASCKKRESVDIFYPGDKTLKMTVSNLLACECYKGNLLLPAGLLAGRGGLMRGGRI